MKVLQIHNQYLYPGGEDSVVHSEAEMLRSFGHEVIIFQKSNHEIAEARGFRKLLFYFRDIYFSRYVYDEVRRLIREKKPDVAHFHNSFFIIGPAAYMACFDAGVPVVQTLHNYRFLCAVATFFRSGKVCEECLCGGRWRGVRHGCWHGVLSTWFMTRIIREYEGRGILKMISKFIALSEFSRQKFIQAGWAGERIVVKPNFLEHDPGIREGAGKYVLYVGALQPYKGVGTLLKAWGLKARSLPLKIVGSGPLEKEFKAQGVAGVEWLGQRTPDEVMKLIKGAVCVVLPSECYENFLRVIIEAYACGVPVVTSRLGSREALVEDGRTGVLFESGNAESLAAAMEKVLTDDEFVTEAGKRARHIFEERYTSSVNHQQLMDVYEQILPVISGKV